MSTTNFKDFMAKVASDEKVRAAFAERFETGKQIPAEELIAFAGEQGYAFTVEEAEEELSDEALEGVAGGTNYVIGDLKNVMLKGESLDPSLDSSSVYPKIEYSSPDTSFTFYGF